MTLYILFRYFHFILIFAIFSSLVAEHLLLKASMTRRELRSLATLDAIYGVSAILLVIVGLVLWFSVGKPADFYTKNWIFHIKVALFVIVALLSIYPTVFFMKNRKGTNLDEVIVPPKSIKMLIRLELLLLLIIPLLAALMAQGVGYFGR